LCDAIAQKGEPMVTTILLISAGLAFFAFGAVAIVAIAISESPGGG
jgi:hypothetical protein